MPLFLMMAVVAGAAILPVLMIQAIIKGGRGRSTPDTWRRPFSPVWRYFGRCCILLLLSINGTPLGPPEQAEGTKNGRRSE